MVTPPQDRSITDRVSRLSRDCARSVEVDGGSVALVSAEGARVVRVATDEVALALEDAQIELGEGPYVDAQSAVLPLSVPDLAHPTAPERWPFFVRQAQLLGVHALFAFPITVSTVSVATLGLYRRRSGGLDSGQLDLAMSAAQDIGHALLDLDETPDQIPPTGLDVAATARLHQAAGMVMVQADVSIVEAMALLRAISFSEDIALPELAREVVERRRRVVEGEPG